MLSNTNEMILVEINFTKPLSVNVWLTVFAAFNGN